MAKGLTDDQLKALTDTEMRQATGYWGGKLEEMRRKNEYYFLGLPKGDLAPPEIEGRSSVVVKTVQNTVLGMMAPLIKTFCGGENVVEFAATAEGDEDKATQATEYLNYLLTKKNPGYSIIATWIMDALVQKVGIIKVWWDDSVVETREEYRGQTDVQLALLLDDEEVVPIEQRTYPDEDAAKQKEQMLQQAAQQLQQLEMAAAQAAMSARGMSGAQNQGLQPPAAPPQVAAFEQAKAQFAQLQAAPVPMLYDIAVKRRKKGGRIRVENVPPEEFLISKKAKSIADTPFCGHRLRRTISDLKAMGYDNVDLISSDDNNAEMNAEHVERVSYDDEAPQVNSGEANTDPSMRTVWLTECYLKADVDGDGIAEWRKVVRSGNQILENVECDGPPFVALCPTPLPHRFFGLCPADLAQEPQRIQTSLLRAQLDNIYLTVNGRYYAVENQVNLDDLLTSRPGGVVRVKSPQAVGRLDQGAPDAGRAMDLLNWFEAYTEEATGWTRQSQGGNGLQLNQTATQSNIITNRADSRVEIISRQFAETGFTELFKMMLKLVTQHQDRAEIVKLGNKWQNIDPREWTNQFDLTINVGLGTGNKDQAVQHLTALINLIKECLQIGVAVPENLYRAAVKLAETLGFKNAEQFFTDPNAPPDPNAPQKPPPPPDPKIVAAQMQAQAQQQIEQGRMAFEHQKHADEMQATERKAQLEAQVAVAAQQAQAEQARQQNELEAQRAHLQFQQQLARDEAAAAREDTFRRWKAQLDSDTAIAIAQIGAKQVNDPGLAAAEQNANQGLVSGN